MADTAVKVVEESKVKAEETARIKIDKETERARKKARKAEKKAKKKEKKRKKDQQSGSTELA